MTRYLVALILTLQVLQPASVRKAIQARYDGWSKAYMSNDVEAMLEMLAPDYTLTDSEGTLIKRSEYEAALRLRKRAAIDSKRYRTTILKLQLVDGGADVTARESIEWDQDGKTVIHRHDYRDTWILTGGKWLLHATVTLKETTKIKT